MIFFAVCIYSYLVCDNHFGMWSVTSGMDNIQDFYISLSHGDTFSVSVVTAVIIVVLTLCTFTFSFILNKELVKTIKLLIIAHY